MAFRLTSKAKRDIESIGDYLASRSPKAAVELVARFIDRWTLLATQPHSGQSVDDLSGLRRLVIGEYLTFYRVEDGDIVVMRVLHGRRDVSEEDFSD